MTVSTTSYLVQYNGTGSTVDFATGFEFIADADLVVQETVVATGVTTTKVLTTDYTVAGAGSDAGGTVTFVTAPASGVRVTIYRSTALTQATDYTEGDPFPAETHEQALDKLTLISQENQGKFERALQFRETEDRSGGTKNSYVPSPSEGKVLAWDSDGNLENVSFGTISYDLSISGGDTGKPVGVNATEDGIEVLSALPADFVDKQAMQDDSVGTNEVEDGAITEPKLAASSVVFSKLASSIVAVNAEAADSTETDKLVTPQMAWRIGYATGMAGTATVDTSSVTSITGNYSAGSTFLDLSSLSATVAAYEGWLVYVAWTASTGAAPDDGWYEILGAGTTGDSVSGFRVFDVGASAAGTGTVTIYVPSSSTLSGDVAQVFTNAAGTICSVSSRLNLSSELYRSTSNPSAASVTGRDTSTTVNLYGKPVATVPDGIGASQNLIHLLDNTGSATTAVEAVISVAY